MSRVEVLILGAGMSGLMAARSLQQAGREVLVVDKGRGFGGRMALRRIGEATFEHGAQFLEARSEDFTRRLAAWRQDGLIVAWDGTAREDSAQQPRFRGREGLNGLARHLADGLTVRRSTRATAVAREAEGWAVNLEDGTRLHGLHLLLTCPVPQAVDLLAAGNVALADNRRDDLAGITYERCLTVMAVPAAPGRIPAPGLLELTEGPLARLCDHHQQGISRAPAVTLQATHDFSLRHWDEPREDAARTLLAAAAPWLPGAIIDHQIHGWRYARPLTPWPEPLLVLESQPALILAGDAFGGHDLESAAASGLAAARFLNAGG